MDAASLGHVARLKDLRTLVEMEVIYDFALS
jgi:hypothetical protein